MRYGTMFAVGFGLVLGGMARAASVVTTAVLPSGSANRVICSALNVGTKPADVRVEIVNAIGVVQATNSDSLDPGITIAVVDFTPADSYCRVTGLSEKKMRVSLCMATATETCLSVATAP
jgi:hypothetical protein